MSRKFLSFNLDELLKNKSIEPLLLTLMYFSKGLVDEKKSTSSFAIEVKQEKREELKLFFKKHGLKSFVFLDPYHNTIIPENQYQTPSKHKKSDSSIESPSFLGSPSTSSIASSPSAIAPTIRDFFFEKAKYLRTKLNSDEKLHLLHLDQSAEFQGTPIVEGDFSCFVIKEKKEQYSMLTTAGREIGLTEYAKNLLTNKEPAFFSEENKELLKNLAAIRYLLLTNSNNLEKLKNLVINFHQVYDTNLSDEQRKSLLELETTILGKKFVKEKIAAEEQMRVERAAKKAFKNLETSNKQGKLRTHYLTNFTRHLFPYLSTSQKQIFVSSFLNDDFITRMLQNEKNLFEKISDKKLDTPKNQEEKKETALSLSTAIIRKELTTTIELQKKASHDAEHFQKIKETSIFRHIPILGKFLVSLVAFFYIPTYRETTEKTYPIPKITPSKLSFLQKIFAHPPALPAPTSSALPKPRPHSIFCIAGEKTAYLCDRRTKLMDTLLPHTSTADKNTLQKKTCILKRG